MKRKMIQFMFRLIQNKNCFSKTKNKNRKTRNCILFRITHLLFALIVKQMSSFEQGSCLCLSFTTPVYRINYFRMNFFILSSLLFFLFLFSCRYTRKLRNPENSETFESNLFFGLFFFYLFLYSF